MNHEGEFGTYILSAMILASRSFKFLWNSPEQKWIKWNYVIEVIHFQIYEQIVLEWKPNTVKKADISAAVLPTINSVN
jgi:hypothetical protein